MTTAQDEGPTSPKPLRLWPGVAAAALLCVVRYVIPLVVPDALIFAVIGALAGALTIIVWWLFFSRAPWSERVGAIVLMLLALFATSRLVHVSIRTGGMGFLFYFQSIPVLCLALVAGVVTGHRLSDGLRRATMAATILLACGAFMLLRTGGVTGGGDSDLRWRWTKTPEERLLASQEPTRQVPAQPGPAPQAEGNDWPGFRGPDRDSIIRGVRIETDWSRFPPIRLWRRPIGPGWSSFAVHGDLLYTQEQRGEDELVVCHKVSTGDPVWQHGDAVRFWESNAGAGPRATPTLRDGRVYTFGATGILNALDATNGAVVWSGNVAADTGKKVPMWGFASSPLVVDDVVIIAATGTLVGYDVATGRMRWSGPPHLGGYTSPHRATIAGVEQVLLLTGDGVISVGPADGKLLWEHAWPGVPIVQPALIADGDILISAAGASGGIGLRRIAVTRRPGGWSSQERWTSRGLKPYYNDFVIHKGDAYGFDGSILACVGLEEGKRRWKDGRYGNGQLVLLADQDLLLVLSEKGELGLVSATPDQFKELARFPAIEGKTWNHPVLVGDVLLARNGEEMAAFRLSLPTGPGSEGRGAGLGEGLAE